VYLTAQGRGLRRAGSRARQDRECISLPADVSKMSEIDRLGAELERRESRLDVLINNAGAGWVADFADFPESGWDKVMDLNVKSVFFLTQRLLKLLEAAGSADDFARVINIGSVDGLHVSELEHYPYSASKAGVLHLTRAMAVPRQAPDRDQRDRAGPFPSQMTLSLEDQSYHDRSIRDTPMAAGAGPRTWPAPRSISDRRPPVSSTARCSRSTAATRRRASEEKR
jgi:NAD(P)-dependent dehydrogenase (short-subunit alcohol dehydrogenase family)